jgi:hypothetical protein
VARDVVDEMFPDDKQPKKQEVTRGSKEMEQSMGAMEAAMEGLKEGTKAYIQGIGAVLSAMANVAYSPEMKDFVKHGSAEIGALLNTGQSYVMYPRESHNKQSEQFDHGLGDRGLEHHQEKGRSR